jgi:hypothetical protein
VEDVGLAGFVALTAVGLDGEGDGGFEGHGWSIRLYQRDGDA